jgi:hypothetical protein
MARTPEDNADARQALETWLTQKPGAAIVVAAIDDLPGGVLDVSMRLSAFSGYHLMGLMQALVEQVLASVADAPDGAKLAPEYETLLQIKELIESGPG